MKMSKEQNKKSIITLMFILLFSFMFFPIPVLAKQKTEETKNWKWEVLVLPSSDVRCQMSDVRCRMSENMEFVRKVVELGSMNKNEADNQLSIVSILSKIEKKNYELETDLMDFQTKNVFCTDAKFCVSTVIAKQNEDFSEILIKKFPVSDKKNVSKIEKKVKARNNLLKIQRVNVHIITAYNSEESQCDDNPCITANGFDVCSHNKEDTIAANFLKFGTKVQIPNLFGDRVFIVRDRMHKKHFNKVDVWMANKQDAIKFGVKIAKIEVLE